MLELESVAFLTNSLVFWKLENKYVAINLSIFADLTSRTRRRLILQTIIRVLLRMLPVIVQQAISLARLQ